MTATEAIYAFAAWLTTRNDVTVCSAHNDSAPIASLVADFVRVNCLDPLPTGWAGVAWVDPDSAEANDIDPDYEAAKTQAEADHE